MSPTPLSTTGEPRMIAERYELVEERGRGPRTALFAALDHSLSRRVLVRLFVAGATERERLQQQEAEVRRLANLEHPALIRLFDAGIDTQPDGSPVIFVVTAHNDGRDLHDAVAESPLSPSEVAQLGADLADALSLLHHHDRPHGRVLPSNILVETSDDGLQGTLTDIESGFVASVLPGVVPAGRRDDPVVDTAASGLFEPNSTTQDVYSLGYCLALALRGSSPQFHADGRLRVGVLTARPLGEILRHMMSPDPADRPSAAEAGASLRDYALSEIPVTTPIRVVGQEGHSPAGEPGLLDSAPDELFNRITRLATSLTSTPISVLSFIADDIATPRGATGLDDLRLGVSIDGALCAITARRSTPWTVEDIWSDPRTRDVGLTLTPDQVTSYAAAPLRMHDGSTVGSLCVFDSQRRRFSDEDLAMLVELAAIAMRDVELSATGRRSRELFG